MIDNDNFLLIISGLNKEIDGLKARLLESQRACARAEREARAGASLVVKVNEEIAELKAALRCPTTGVDSRICSCWRHAPNIVEYIKMKENDE